MDQSKAFEFVDSTDNLSMKAVDQETSSGRRRSGRIFKAPDYFANTFNDTTSTFQAGSTAGNELTSSRKVSQKKRKSTDSSATESAKEDKRIRVSDASRSSDDSTLSSPASSPELPLTAIELLQKAQLDTIPAGRTSATNKQSPGVTVAGRRRTRAQATGRRPNATDANGASNESSELGDSTMATVSGEPNGESRPKPYGIPPVHADVCISFI